MVIKPKVMRGFICTAAHPDGCAAAVKSQIDYVKQHDALKDGPRKILVLGCSTGYGLASRIVTTFSAGAETLGVCFEKPATGKRTASAGWYNTVAFEEEAKKAGIYAKTINGDAFSDTVKQQVIDTIKQDLGQVDAIIYSLAAPRRTDPDSGEVYNSVLKTVGDSFINNTVDPIRGVLKEVTIEPASTKEIEDTIAVMGGADLERWVDMLLQADVLAKGIKVYAYSYIGPSLTYPIYRDGTIGKAKADVQQTCDRLRSKLKAIEGDARVAVNKAVVTQASAAIPVVPLYLAVVMQVMKRKDLHEGCIEQMYRLAKDHIYAAQSLGTDAAGMIRIDGLELREDVQQEVSKIWKALTEENLERLTDLVGYRRDFFQLFGFEWPGIDYDAETQVERYIPSIPQEDTAE